MTALGQVSVILLILLASLFQTHRIHAENTTTSAIPVVLWHGMGELVYSIVALMTGMSKSRAVRLYRKRNLYY